ncbi:MAG: sulfotransferase [Pseudomonadota bacterium]
MSKVVYICSAGHSGSTLLDMLIGSHSKITSLGEISQLPKNLSLNTDCTCGKKVKHCEFWDKVLKRVDDELKVQSKIFPYSLNLGYFTARIVVDSKHQNKWNEIKKKVVLGLYYLSLKSFFPVPQVFISKIINGAKNSFVLYKHVTDVMGGEYIVDSSKNYLKAISLYKENPEKVRIIVLSRDGRGVFYSGRKRGFSKNESLGAWKKYYTRSLPLIEKHVNSNHILKIHYEDLASSTANELAKISAFIGVEFEENMLDFSSKIHHLTNGNNMRFRSSEVKLDQSWKQCASVSDLEFFETNAGFLNKKLGYD